MPGSHEGDVPAAGTGEQAAARLSADCERMTAEETVARVLRTVPRVALACSFSAEDMVLLDMVMAIQRDAHVFYLDTDLLFPETYALRDRAVARYGIPGLVRVTADLTVAQQAWRYGDDLWARDPDACCALRKVGPLEKLLADYDGWITGIRRDQSPARSRARSVEWDGRFGLVKVNPLAEWTADQVWRYLTTHDVPYNPLHDQGYPSIGCIHCTRPVDPGADARSGRWSDFSKTECGLHAGG